METFEQNIPDTDSNHALNNPAKIFDEALAHHEAGRLTEAETLYLQLLNADPADAESWYLTATIAYQQARYTCAAERIGRCIEIAPDNAEALHLAALLANQRGEYQRALDWAMRLSAIAPAALQAHTCLGQALQGLCRYQEAEANYRRALAIGGSDPSLNANFGEIHFNLAVVLHRAGNLDAAVDNYRQALALLPKNIAIHNNLGIALSALYRHEEAAIAFRQVIALDPRHATAHNDLGNIYKAENKLDEAINCYRKASDINPQHAPAHCNLASTLQQLGDPNAALIHHRIACTLKPDDAMYRNNLAITLEALDQFNEAIDEYRAALNLKPDSAEIQNNLGSALKSQGQLNAAIGSYQNAILHRADFSLAHSNLGNALLEQGNIDAALDSYRKALSFDPSASDVHSNLLLAKHYHPDYSPAELLRDHEEFSKIFEARVQRIRHVATPVSVSQRRLKIGFVSGDLCEHPVGYFLQSTLAHLDREIFDIALYSTRHRADAVTQTLRSMPLHWHSLTGLADSDAARRIYNDGIQILIDLSGHTGYNRLPMFCYKPAPLQVSWLGYWATTGLRCMDYILCDPYSVHEDEVDQFIEQPCFLPETRLCFTPPAATIEIGELPALGNGYPTFGCFNNRAKINTPTIALWARLLTEIPDSRLIIKTRQFSEASLREEMATHFAAHGIASHRLVLEGPSARADYLAAYNRIDIALDPFPFTGGTTSVEALWMGVPFVTRQGHHMLSRQGESILHNVGLADWIATDENHYIEQLIKRTADLTALANLRRQLRARLLRSPLCDAPRFAGHLGVALQQMWHRYQQAAPA